MIFAAATSPLGLAGDRSSPDDHGECAKEAAVPWCTTPMNSVGGVNPGGPQLQRKRQRARAGLGLPAAREAHAGRPSARQEEMTALGRGHARHPADLS
jgi:hypothetical protein